MIKFHPPVILVLLLALPAAAVPITLTEGSASYYNALYPYLYTGIHAGSADFEIDGYTEAGGPFCGPCVADQPISLAVSVVFPFGLPCCSAPVGYSTVMFAGQQYGTSASVQFNAPTIVLASGQAQYSVPFQMHGTVRQGQATGVLAYCVVNCLEWEIEGSGIATASFTWFPERVVFYGGALHTGDFEGAVSITYAFTDPTAVPEPGTLAMIGLALTILAGGNLPLQFCQQISNDTFRRLFLHF